MKHITKNERTFLTFSIALTIMLLCTPQTYAMHIMEGYLPAGQCIAWGVIAFPFLALSLVSIRRTIKKQPKALLLLAMSGAFIFVMSSLKIPSVTGSCSHMTGTGLAAILFGPFHAGILGLIVLLFQSLLLAHGGITTIGANTFSMSIAGPIFTWVIFLVGKKMKLNRKVNIFIAAMFGDLLTYCFTSGQLAFAYPSAEGGVMASLVKFLGVFATTQLSLAIIEGILTVVIVIGMESFAKTELQAIGFLEEGIQYES